MTTTEKTCFKCGITQPICAFYRHPMMKDGHLNKCKSCTKVDVRDNRVAHRDYYREYEASRSMLPHRIESRDVYQQTDAGRAAARRARKRYAERYPSKRAAHIACKNAVRDGKLMRQPCEKCGSPVTQAHHDDYSRPLDVRWLCTTHHAEWHRHNDAKYPEQEKVA